jgi:hypothetical protein
MIFLAMTFKYYVAANGAPDAPLRESVGHRIFSSRT